MSGGASAQLLPVKLLNRMLLRLGLSHSSDRSLAIHDRDSTLNVIRLFRAANNVVAYRLEIIEIVAAKGWLEIADRIVVITATLAMTESGSRKTAWFRNLPVRLPVSLVSRTILLTSLLVSRNCSLSGARALS